MKPIEDDLDVTRGDCYAVLARLFMAPPDEACLAALSAADATAGSVQGALPDAWALLGARAAQATPESAQREYEALFVAVGRPRVVLYASWYLTGFMMEKPLAVLRDDLAALGLARRDGVREPEDHFAALLEVMRHLVGDDSHSEEQRLALQQRFFLAHIDPWCAKLCDAVEALDDAVLYRAAANFARAFLAVEKTFLGGENRRYKQ